MYYGIGIGLPVRIFAPPQEIITYLLRDEFTTPASAPLTSPHIAEPGPGSFTITDPNNMISVNAGGFYLDPTSSLSGNGILSATSFANTSGLAFLARITKLTNSIAAGFRNTGITNLAGAWLGVGVVLSTNGNAINAVAFPLTVNEVGNNWVIRRASGGAFFIQNTKLHWVDTDVNASALPVGLSINGNNRGGQVSFVRVYQLPTPFTDPYGIATQRLAGARAQGDTFAHEADFLIEFTCTTRPSSDSHRIQFRAQDATNYWEVTIDSSGNLTLNNIVAGVSTQRGTAAAAVANGNRVVVIAEGAIIVVCVNYSRSFSYSSATQFATATAGSLLSLGTGGVITNIVTWPRVLTGAAAAALNLNIPVVVTYGDSITAGQNSSATNAAWASIVARSKRWNLVNSGVGGIVLQNTVQNTAAVIGGALTNNMQDNYVTKVLAYSPNYVILAGGLNDLRFNDAAFTAATFQTSLGLIVDGIIAAGIPAANICIGSPPYIPNASYSLSSPYNGGNATKHAQYVAAAAAVAAAKGTKYADIYQAMVDGGGDTLISGDGIHPNDAGHVVAANAFLAAL